MLMSAATHRALVILAAGNSSRLGQPKQQLMFQEKNLLERAVQAGRGSPVRSIWVVLGANHQEILQQSDLQGARTVIHQDWKLGMGSSIKAGLLAVLEDELPDEVILMVCDQPFVDGKLLSRLISVRQDTGKGIVACSYSGTLGVPVLFQQAFFSLLLDMDDAAGAKKLLQAHQQDLAVVPFERGSIDIDTAEDYQQLLAIQKRERDP